MEGEQTGRRDRLGKYALLTRLGRGGMGEVWKARDTQLQRYVALKLLRADLRDDPEFTAHFMREARLVAALRHPNIVQIHDFQLASQAEENDYAYMVMDYIEGGTLADAIHGTVRKGVFWSASEIVDLFGAISLALDYAHGQRMIHRDIKPANILLDRSLAPMQTLGQPILTDFGIARWQGSGSTVTGFVGTPLYISPEQAQGHSVDARSDLYSLGIILYEVLTGQTPFRGDNPLAIMMQHLETQPPAPALLNPLISPALSAVILQSIAKNPQERFPSASAMTRALAQAFNVSASARLDGSGESLRKYNPLQPFQGAPGLKPLAASSAVSAPPQNSISTRNYTEAIDPSMSELHRVTIGAAEITGGTPGPNSSVREHVSAQTAEIPPPFSSNKRQVSPGRPGRRPLGRWAWKWLLAGCAILLLLGLGIFAVGPRLSQASGSSTPTAGNAIVGQILFSRSSSTAYSPFNELRIDLIHVSPPPTGQTYYAWLMRTDSEASVPHWSLQVSNGAIHDQYTASPPQVDLLAQSVLFLITVETTSSVPVIPSPSPAAHLYYALIKHTSPVISTFAVNQCPTSNLDSPSNPCR